MATVTIYENAAHSAISYTGSGSGLTNIPRSGLNAGTANQVVINDGSGNLSSEAHLATTRGGLGVDSSAFTGVGKVAAGVWSASTIVDADVSSSAAIARSKLAAGTASYVVINDGSGVLSEEQHLSNVRGGTGIDTSSSTGVAKVSAGTWSVSQIVNADVASNAAIALSKLAGSTANSVVITDGSGNLSTELQLDVAKGGLGQDFSGVGAGPFVLTNSSGTFSCNVQYSSANTASALVQRDGSGNFSAGTITATQVTAATIATSSGDLSLAPTGANVALATKSLTQAPSTVAGGQITYSSANLQTTDATTTTLFTLATASNVSYTVEGIITIVNSTDASSVGLYRFVAYYKNVSGTVTASALFNALSALESGVSGVAVTSDASGTNGRIRVTGLASTNIKWCLKVAITQQAY